MPDTMGINLWAHQVQTSYLQARIGVDDNRYPAIAEIWEKTTDGLRWMSTFDRHPRAISGLSVVAQRAREHREAGRVWRPWAVVAGRTSSNDTTDQHAIAEGKLLAAIAKSADADAVILDVEPYYHGGAVPQFWRGDLGANARTVRALLDAFAGAAPGREVWVSLDARSAHFAPINFEAWRDHPTVTRFLPQTYWTDFTRPRVPTTGDAVGAINNANAQLAARGVPARRVYHVLPGDSPTDVLRDAIAHLRQAGNPAPSVWQRLNITPQNLTAIAGLPDWPRVDEDEDVLAAIAEVRAAVDRLEAIVRAA